MGSRMKTAVLLALSLLLCACQVTSDPYGRTVMSTPTVGQMLGVAPRSGTQPGAPDARAIGVAAAPGRCHCAARGAGHSCSPALPGLLMHAASVPVERDRLEVCGTFR